MADSTLITLVTSTAKDLAKARGQKNWPKPHTVKLVLEALVIVHTAVKAMEAKHGGSNTPASLRG